MEYSESLYHTLAESNKDNMKEKLKFEMHEMIRGLYGLVES
jgi:hypothetical protein